MLINSSLLDIEGTLDSGEEAMRQNIKKWIKDNFKVDGLKISDHPNIDGKYEVSADDVNIVNKNIKSLTNKLFVWSKIKKDFYCYNCPALTSLEGAPKYVSGDFSCSRCYNLKSLEGAPKEVGGDFDCWNCDNLSSLEGAPNYVGGYFNYTNCDSLKSKDLPVTTKVNGKIYK